jgi:tRNA-uridine 2-sulfurtransferase
MEKKKKKALVLFSGGLDSRIAAKIMEEQGFEVELCFVKLPFGGGCCNNMPCIINFAQTSGYRLHVVDSTKDEKFREYVEIIRNPKYGCGAGLNPCKDCKIFIFREGKKLADSVGASVIVTGEVIGQRPMSQMKKALMFDDEMAGLTGKILRPLSAKLLPETDYEKSGFVDVDKMFGIHGRRREVQMKLAEKYKIKYPSPAGGCLLCEKIYSEKLKMLFEYSKDLKYEEILLLNRARMFKKKGLVFVGRNEEENLFIMEVAKKLKWKVFFKEGVSGPSVVYDREEDSEFAKELWEVYSSGNVEDRKKFSEWKVE